MLMFTVSAAEPRNEVTEARYRSLWQSSPFTSPAEDRPVPKANPIDHYVLGGISKFENGYHLVLFDRRDPAGRIVIRPGVRHPIRVVGVERSSDHPINTRVTIREGEHQGVVAFDMDFIRTMSPGTKTSPKTPSGEALSGNRPIRTRTLPSAP